jgi:hypothetical protein
MTANLLIAARVTPEIKTRFAGLAHQQGVTESALLKGLVEAALVSIVGVKSPSPDFIERVNASGRLSIRLRSDDLLMLRERAGGRTMPTSTYVSLLIRSHLRAITPLPTAELDALKRSVAEISAIGRNLNQIARAANQGERPSGPSKADLHALLRALEGLRVHIKGLINANLTSWRTGHEKTNH